MRLLGWADRQIAAQKEVVDDFDIWGGLLIEILFLEIRARAS